MPGDSAKRIEQYMKSLGMLSEYQRSEVYSKIADEFGDGFARQVRAEFNRRHTGGSQA